MKKTLIVLASCFVMAFSANGQTYKSMIAEDGGTGPYKAEIVADSSFTNFTIYRPQNLAEVVKKEGKLPIILYANGACANTSVEIRHFLNEVVSHGYIAIAIGPYSDEDFYEHWRKVMGSMYPKNGKKVILGNGEEIKKVERTQSANAGARPQGATAGARPQGATAGARPQGATAGTRPQGATAGARPQGSAQRPSRQSPNSSKSLLEAMDWISAQSVDPKSEYYHCVDLEKVVAMGQSCGGCQALAISYDPRIKTCVIMNSGIGNMGMQGATKETLNNLHTPMFYLIGGPNDLAYKNSAMDFEAINNVPIVMINTQDEHEGTYYEKNGGAYAVIVRHWLNWQLKGQQSESKYFLDSKALLSEHPDWVIERKNIK